MEGENHLAADKFDVSALTFSAFSRAFATEIPMNSITRATPLFSTLITAPRVRNSSASSCLRTRIKKHEADGRSCF